MKYLKLFEDYNKDLIHQLALQGDANSTMDRLDSSKMVPVKYKGTLMYDNDKYYLQIKNIQNKPYKVEGIPPAPTLFIELVPTEYFTADDFKSYQALSSIKTYGSMSRDETPGKYIDYNYIVSGWTIPSENTPSGVERIVHITDLEKS
jgi:hypothetical protein